MKFKFIAVVTAIAFFAISCQKNVAKTAADNIVGKWYYALDTLKSSQNGGPFTIISTSNYTSKVDYLQFNSDGSGVDFYNSTGANFTYTIANNVVTFNYAAMTVSSGGITTTIAAFTEKAKIRSVSNTQLSILFDDFTTTNGVTEEDYEAKYFSK